MPTNAPQIRPCALLDDEPATEEIRDDTAELATDDMTEEATELATDDRTDDAVELATDEATEDRTLEATELDERLKRARGEAASRPDKDGNSDSVSKQRVTPAKK